MLWYKIIAHSIGLTRKEPSRNIVEHLHNYSVRTDHNVVYTSQSFKMLYSIFNDFYKYDFVIQRLDNNNNIFYEIFTFTFEIYVCDDNDKVTETKIVDVSTVGEVKCFETLNDFIRNPKCIKKDYLIYSCI